MDNSNKTRELAALLRSLNPQSGAGNVTPTAQVVVDNPASVSDAERSAMLTQEQLQMAMERMRQNDLRTRVLNKIYLDKIGRGELQPMPDTFEGTLEQYLRGDK